MGKAAESLAGFPDDGCGPSEDAEELTLKAELIIKLERENPA